MLSVIIPTEGVEQTAVATLAALVPGVFFCGLAWFRFAY